MLIFTQILALSQVILLPPPPPLAQPHPEHTPDSFSSSPASHMPEAPWPRWSATDISAGSLRTAPTRTPVPSRPTFQQERFFRDIGHVLTDFSARHPARLPTPDSITPTGPSCKASLAQRPVSPQTPSPPAASVFLQRSGPSIRSSSRNYLRLEKHPPGQLLPLPESPVKSRPVSGPELTPLCALQPTYHPWPSGSSFPTPHFSININFYHRINFIYYIKPRSLCLVP